MNLNIQILRFFAAMAVVLHHATAPVIPQSFVPQLASGLKLVQNMGFSGVDVFFVISGAIMSMTTRSSMPGPRTSLRFALLRLGRIYSGWWPFFILYLYAYFQWHALGDKNLLASFLLLPASLNTYIPPIIWTLSFELYFYMMLAVLLMLPRKQLFAVLSLIGAAVVVYSGWSWANGYFTPEQFGQTNALQQFFLMPLVGEFIAGFMISEYLHKRERAPARAGERYAWLLLAAALAVLATWYQHDLARYPSGMAGFFHAPERALLLGGMSCALIVWAIRAPAPRRPITRFLGFRGNDSYAIYLSHLLVFAAIYWLVQKYLPGLLQGPKRIWLVYLLAILAAPAYSLLHYRFIERPLHQGVRNTLARLLPKTGRQHA